MHTAQLNMNNLWTKISHNIYHQLGHLQHQHAHTLVCGSRSHASTCTHVGLWIKISRINMHTRWFVDQDLTHQHAHTLVCGSRSHASTCTHVGLWIKISRINMHTRWFVDQDLTHHQHTRWFVDQDQQCQHTHSHTHASTLTHTHPHTNTLTYTHTHNDPLKDQDLMSSDWSLTVSTHTYTHDGDPLVDHNCTISSLVT